MTPNELRAEAEKVLIGILHDSLAVRAVDVDAILAFATRHAAQSAEQLKQAEDWILTHEGAHCGYFELTHYQKLRDDAEKAIRRLVHIILTSHDTEPGEEEMAALNLVDAFLDFATRHAAEVGKVERLRGRIEELDNVHEAGILLDHTRVAEKLEQLRIELAALEEGAERQPMEKRNAISHT